MALGKIYLDTNKAVPFNPVKLIVREGDANEILPIQLSKNFLGIDLSAVELFFEANKVDGKIIIDKDRSHFTNISKDGFFNYHLPKELYQKAGAIKMAYFGIGDRETTSNFQISVLRKVGTPESSDSYITDAEKILENMHSQNEASDEVLQDSRDKFTEIDTGWETRKTTIDGVVQDAKDATADTITATDKATASADKADTATANADKATADAKTATDNAETATDNAETATAQAVEATGNATQATAETIKATEATKTATEDAITATTEAQQAKKDAEDFITDAPNNPAFKGPKGDKGDIGPQGEQGVGLKLMGTLDSATDLPDTGGIGEAYNIAGDVYFYDQTLKKWQNYGPLTGAKGDKGDKGETGLQGPKGETGDVGPQGEQGIQGPIGETGKTGEIGPIGPKGETGETGLQGPKGDPGEDGKGLQIDGSADRADALPDGKPLGTTYLVAGYVYTYDGSTWVNCGQLQGPIGATGQDGDSAYQVWLDNGHEGTVDDFIASLKGDPGKDGTDGQNGASAYQVWLDAGNTGTEAEFLESLKGKDGSDGADGAVGPAGVADIKILSAYKIAEDPNYFRNVEVNAIKINKIVYLNVIALYFNLEKGTAFLGPIPAEFAPKKEVTFNTTFAQYSEGIDKTLILPGKFVLGVDGNIKSTAIGGIARDFKVSLVYEGV